MTLPPGQRPRTDHPRFGLPWYAHKLPRTPGEIWVEVRGPDGALARLTAAELGALDPREQVSDFHCVATWSRLGLRWRGYGVREVYEQVLAPAVDPGRRATHIRFVGVDGYRDTLPLQDALADDVLLADGLDGAPLPLKYGAPLRLVAPAHYGHKSIKHLVRIELLGRAPRRPPLWLKHPRARVDHEERFGGLPGPAIRRVYRAELAANLWYFRIFDKRRGIG